MSSVAVDRPCGWGGGVKRPLSCEQCSVDRPWGGGGVKRPLSCEQCGVDRPWGGGVVKRPLSCEQCGVDRPWGGGGGRGGTLSAPSLHT